MHHVGHLLDVHQLHGRIRRRLQPHHLLRNRAAILNSYARKPPACDVTRAEHLGLGRHGIEDLIGTIGHVHESHIDGGPVENPPEVPVGPAVEIVHADDVVPALQRVQQGRHRRQTRRKAEPCSVRIPCNANALEIRSNRGCNFGMDERRDLRYRSSTRAISTKLYGSIGSPVRLGISFKSRPRA